MRSALSAALRAAADAAGVATTYRDFAGRRVAVSADTVRTLLDILGSVPHAGGPPPTVPGRPDRPLVVPGLQGPVEVQLEDGTRRSARARDGAVDLAGLPLGYHRVTGRAAGRRGAQRGEAVSTLVVGPRRAPSPQRRHWGWSVQLYQLRSAGSWGLGDASDLATVVRWAAADGADFVQVNPLLAEAPVRPQQDSPYSPVSRRFVAASVLRPTALPEYDRADGALRAQVGAWHAASSGAGQIDRDRAFDARSAALAALAPRRLPAPTGVAAGWARYAVLAARHGADWRQWPDAVRAAHGAAAAALPGRQLAVQAWIQRRSEEAVRAAQLAARDAGMAIGVIHDLPVGVAAGGADSWLAPDLLRTDASIGAPPDSFNQQGQDWGLPPWHPGQLAATGYQAWREVLAAGFARGGGLRIDHVLGLFRLWWVPAGAPAAAGAYVRYDADALLTVLALEAHRAGGVVIGEDLGTVPPAAARALRARGILGSDLAIFAAEPPQRWRPAALASVTTHDLPTAAGWLTDEAVRVRAELGQLGHSVAVERRRAAAERAQVRTALRAGGVAWPVGRDRVAEQVHALHASLLRSPAQLVAVQPADAVGDRHQPNLPGRSSYPSWRLPLRDATGTEVRLEDLTGATDPGTGAALAARAVAAQMQTGLGRPAAGRPAAGRPAARRTAADDAAPDRVR